MPWSHTPNISNPRGALAELSAFQYQPSDHDMTFENAKTAKLADDIVEDLFDHFDEVYM